MWIYFPFMGNLRLATYAFCHLQYYQFSLITQKMSVKQRNCNAEFHNNSQLLCWVYILYMQSRDSKRNRILVGHIHGWICTKNGIISLHFSFFSPNRKENFIMKKIILQRTLSILWIWEMTTAEERISHLEFEPEW